MFAVQIMVKHWIYFRHKIFWRIRYGTYRTDHWAAVLLEMSGHVPIRPTWALWIFSDFCEIFAHSCLVFCFARVYTCVLYHNAVYSKRVPFCNELVTWSNRFISFEPRNDRDRQSSHFTIQNDIIKLLSNGSNNTTKLSISKIFPG